MQPISRTALVLSLLAVAGLTAAPAMAGGISFSLGAGFTVGNVAVHLAYAAPGYGSGYLPYYYRIPVELYYPGYACTTGCLKSARYVYHAPGCPLILRHFNVFSYVGYVEHYHSHGYYPPYYRYQHRYPRSYHPRRSYRHYGHSGKSRHYGRYERSRPSYRGEAYPRSRHEAYRHESHRVERRHHDRDRDVRQRVEHRGRGHVDRSRGRDYRSRDGGHHRDSSVKGRSSHRGRDGHRGDSGKARRARPRDHRDH